MVQIKIYNVISDTCIIAPVKTIILKSVIVIATIYIITAAITINFIITPAIAINYNTNSTAIAKLIE